MTAPALPPEVVNEVALLFAKRRQHAPTMDGAHNPNPGEIKAAQEAVEIVARALGGDGEPVAWGVRDRTGRVVITGERQSYCDAVKATYDDEIPSGRPFTVVPLYTRPAATGDTGEGGGALIGEAFDLIGHVVNHARRSTNIDGTRRRLGDDEACGRNWIALVDKCEALLATRAATGGPDAR